MLWLEKDFLWYCGRMCMVYWAFFVWETEQPLHDYSCTWLCWAEVSGLLGGVIVNDRSTNCFKSKSSWTAIRHTLYIFEPNWDQWPRLGIAQCLRGCFPEMTYQIPALPQKGYGPQPQGDKKNSSHAATFLVGSLTTFLLLIKFLIW